MLAVGFGDTMCRMCETRRFVPQTTGPSAEEWTNGAESINRPPDPREHYVDESLFYDCRGKWANAWGV